MPRPQLTDNQTSHMFMVAIVSTAEHLRDVHKIDPSSAKTNQDLAMMHMQAHDLPTNAVAGPSFKNVFKGPG